MRKRTFVTARNGDTTVAAGGNTGRHLRFGHGPPRAIRPGMPCRIRMNCRRARDSRMAMHLLHDPAAPPAAAIGFDDFLKVDIRVGRIVTAEPFPEARKPALKLTIDFGPGVGVRRSSAQITEHYSADALIGRMVAAVVNFPPRQIGKFLSEVLTLGFPDADGAVVLFAPDRDVPVGGRLF